MRAINIEAEPTPLWVDLDRDRAHHHRHAARLPRARRLRRDARQRRVAPAARRSQPCRAVLDAARAASMLVIHTREGHRPDLSDAPRAKVERGEPAMRIGAPGPMGRILVRGEPGHDIIPELYPIDGEPVIDKPGKGAFYATDLHADPAEPRDREPARLRRHHRGLRQHHGARGQRPRLPLHRARRLLRLVLPRIPRGRPRHDQGPGRHLRLGVGSRRVCSRRCEPPALSELVGKRDRTRERGQCTMADNSHGLSAESSGRPATGTPSSASARTSSSTC